MTQQYRLASVASWFSSTGFAHHNLLPHIISIHLSVINNSPCPGIAPPSLNSSLCAFQGTSVPVWGMYGCSKDCLILIPFRLTQISCFTLSLKCFFSSDSDSCPTVEIGRLHQFLHPVRAGNTLVFPYSSFILRGFAWLCIFFSTSQVLLSAFSWCSACISVSEGTFLMYPWREMYSTPTYPSTILFSQS